VYVRLLHTNLRRPRTHFLPWNFSDSQSSSAISEMQILSQDCDSENRLILVYFREFEYAREFPHQYSSVLHRSREEQTQSEGKLCSEMRTERQKLWGKQFDIFIVHLFCRSKYRAKYL
jgi:hypothetical protein